MSDSESGELQRLTRELDNFQDNFRYLLPQPGEVPSLAGIEVWGATRPLGGSVGGDHITYVDFKQRYDLTARIERSIADGRHDLAERLEQLRTKAGIALIDVSGHRMTDALLAAMLHQAFLLGAIYELDRSGHITRRLFENLNTRFYQSSGTHKFVSLIYGEVSENATFRFLSAGQPFPLVFSSQHDRFMDVNPNLLVSFPPLGMQPSLNVIDRNVVPSPLGFKERYILNEWKIMGRGDIVLMYTDGLTEHEGPEGMYVPDALEALLRRVKHQSAREIVEAILADVAVFGPPRDDVSVVAIKLT